MMMITVLIQIQKYGHITASAYLMWLCCFLVLFTEKVTRKNILLLHELCEIIQARYV